MKLSETEPVFLLSKVVNDAPHRSALIEMAKLKLARSTGLSRANHPDVVLPVALAKVSARSP